LRADVPRRRALAERRVVARARPRADFRREAAAERRERPAFDRRDAPRRDEADRRLAAVRRRLPPRDPRPRRDSPDSLRCLFTVRAAISSARSALRPPRSRTDSLICSYCRCRFPLTPCMGIADSLHETPPPLWRDAVSD
jgi:hypothetical protein